MAQDLERAAVRRAVDLRVELGEHVSEDLIKSEHPEGLQAAQLLIMVFEAGWAVAVVRRAYGGVKGDEHGREHPFRVELPPEAARLRVRERRPQSRRDL